MSSCWIIERFGVKKDVLGVPFDSDFGQFGNVALVIDVHVVTALTNLAKSSSTHMRLAIVNHADIEVALFANKDLVT